MKNKAFAVIVCIVLVMAMAIPGTLALSTDTDSSQTNAAMEVYATQETTAETDMPAEEIPAQSETSKECNCGVAEGEAHKEGCPLYKAPTEQEKPVDDANECTCDPKPADGEAHQEGCPLYTEPEESVYDRLMAAETADEFMAIIEQASEEELNVLTCEEFDDVDAHYIFLTTGQYPDFSPVVDEVVEIVNYTCVAPFGDPVTGGNN